MHSAIISILAVATGLSNAAVLKRAECSGSGAYYVCGNNGFRGSCSVDPCNLSWCPDYTEKTCAPVAVEQPWAEPEPKSADPVITVDPAKTQPEGTCATGTGYFQSCSNGFRGCCTADACGGAWCPDYTTGTYELATVEVDEAAEHEWTKRAECWGKGAYYVCGNNGFRGACSVDPCAISWCPDYQPNTCVPASAGSWEKPAEKKPEEKKPAEKKPEEKKPAEKKPEEKKPEEKKPEEKKPALPANGVCPQGTGYYQVCSNGFQGCCKADACGNKAPVCPSW